MPVPRSSAARKKNKRLLGSAFIFFFLVSRIPERSVNSPALHKMNDWGQSHWRIAVVKQYNLPGPAAEPEWTDSKDVNGGAKGQRLKVIAVVFAGEKTHADVVYNTP